MFNGKEEEEKKRDHRDEKEKGKSKGDKKKKKQKRSAESTSLNFRGTPLQLRKEAFEFNDAICEALWTAKCSQLQQNYKNYIAYKIRVVKHVNEEDIALPPGTILLVGKGRTRLVYINLNSECAEVMAVRQTGAVKIKFSKQIANIFFPKKKIVTKEKNNENAKLFEQLVLQALSEIYKINLNAELPETSVFTLFEPPSSDEVDSETILSTIDSNAKDIHFLMALINSLLNIDEINIDFFQKIFRYFITQSEIDFPTEYLFVKAFLAQKIILILRDAIKEIFLNQVLTDILHCPSILEIIKKEGYSDNAVFIDPKYPISPLETCVALEQVYTVVSSNEETTLKYFGFEGLHTCIGIVLNNPDTGDTVYAHASKAVDPLELIVNIIRDCTGNFQNIPSHFNLRIVGGTVMGREGKTPIKDSESGKKLKEIMYYLLIVTKYLGVSINMDSADVFPDLGPYRKYREKRTGLCGINILFDRQVRPLIFPCPGFKKGSPYHTGEIFSPIVGNIHFFEIWEPMLRVLGLSVTGILPVYNDSVRNWNHDFLNEAEAKYKHRFMRMLVKQLVIAELAIDEHDFFNEILIARNLDKLHEQWFASAHECFSEKKPLFEEFPFTQHMMHYFTIVAFRHMQEIRPLSETEVVNSFYGRIIASDCLKYFVFNTIFLRFACLLTRESRETIDFDSLAEKQGAIIELCKRCVISPWHLLDAMKDYEKNWMHRDMSEIEVEEEKSNLLIRLQSLEDQDEREDVIIAWQKEILIMEVDFIIEAIQKKLPDIQEEIIEDLKNKLIEYGIKLLPWIHPVTTVQLTYESANLVLTRRDLIAKLIEIIASPVKWGQVESSSADFNVNAISQIVVRFLDNLHVVELSPLLPKPREVVVKNEQEQQERAMQCCVLS